MGVKIFLPAIDVVRLADGAPGRPAAVNCTATGGIEMTIDEGRKPEGALERSPKAGEGAPSGVDANGPKRFSVQRKMAIVARLLRGEPLELVARETKSPSPS